MTDQYRVPDSSARMAQAALNLFAISSVAYAASTYISMKIVDAIRAGTTPMLPAQTADMMTTTVSLIFVICNVASIVLTAIWIYRSNKYAHLLSSEIKTGPVMALVWYAVPILNLSRPLLTMREVWRVSHSPDAPSSVRMPALMPLWWFCWLMFAFAGNLALQLGNRPELDAQAAGNWAELVACGFGFVSSLSLSQIIRRINNQQVSVSKTAAFA